MPRIHVANKEVSKNSELRARVLAAFPDATFNDTGSRHTPHELCERLQTVEGTIIGLDVIDEPLLSRCQSLEVVSKFGVGLDSINFEACSTYGVRVLHTPGVNRRSVSELVLGMMLGLLRNIYVTSNMLKSREWHKDGGMQLSGKTVGIIGIGNVGSDVARLLQPYECRLLGNDIRNIEQECKELRLESVSKGDIYARADVVTIHTPLTRETQNLINKDVLSKMRSSAILINTARGPIVDEDALYEALVTKQIAGAGIDVYSEEPPTNRKIIELQNVICTPHIGGNAREAELAMGHAAIDNLISYFQKLPTRGSSDGG